MQTMRPLALCLAMSLVTLVACDRPSEAPASAAAEAKAANPVLGARWQFPRERTYGDAKVIVYAPQIRTWDQFKHFTAQVAVEFLDADAGARYAALDLSGATVLDREARIVRVAKPKVDRVTFSGGQAAADAESRVRTAVESEPLEIPLDVFLYYLADGVLESPPPAGFNVEPPPIYVVESPAFLLFVNGEPVPVKLGDSGLELVSNASFPVFRDTKSGTHYLLSGDHR